ncbi:hypothetical protein B0H11DRAFT_2257838 [Mycena galericulata]|nr:hypothetical protein B0H11DRAFT_2257838 [Mycena galericulata]
MSEGGQITNLQVRMSQIEARCRAFRKTQIIFTDILLRDMRFRLSGMRRKEEFDSMAICLHAFNRKIFEEQGSHGVILSNEEQSVLYQGHVRCIWSLLDFDIEDYLSRHQVKSKRTKALICAVVKARSILTQKELAFCAFLNEGVCPNSDWRRGGLGEDMSDYCLRYSQRSPELDAATVRKNIMRVAPRHRATLDAVLASNPQRTRDEDDDGVDVPLLAAPGTYRGLEHKKAEIAEMEEDLKKLRAEQEADEGKE